MNRCYTDYTNIGKFISNINGNWRNSIYITCSACKNEKQSCCDDVLVSFDADGKPTFIAVTEVTYTRPEGGLFIWCTLPEGTDAAGIVKKGVEKNVAFVPGSNFMTDMGKPCNCFRLNYSTMTDDKIVEGIGILADVLKENL